MQKCHLCLIILTEHKQKDEQIFETFSVLINTSFEFFRIPEVYSTIRLHDPDQALEKPILVRIIGIYNIKSSSNSAVDLPPLVDTEVIGDQESLEELYQHLTTSTAGIKYWSHYSEDKVSRSAGDVKPHTT